MTRKHKAIIAYLLVTVLHFAFPVSMIWKSEKVLSSGMVFNFKTVPVDPVHPFKGRYVRLNFDIEEFTDTSHAQWTEGEIAYIVFEKDSSGYAKISTMDKKPPANTEYYLKAPIEYAYNEDITNGRLDFPFDRVYMEEFNAQSIDKLFSNARADSWPESFAQVSIFKGQARLTDLVIDDQSVLNK